MSQAEDPKAANRARFELELEFVQALANPYYLHSLAQQNILSQPAFVNFLKYLLYWKEKDYARFIQYVLWRPMSYSVRLICCELSPCSTSPRPPAARTIPLGDRQRRVEGVFESKAVRSLEDMVCAR